MKYWIAMTAAVVAAVGALWWMRMHPNEARAEWKRYAVEPETKDRPAKFEDLKFKPVDVRAPASREDGP